MPDFLVIGAPKAGTTALHVALARHPGLYMSAVKEPNEGLLLSNTYRPGVIGWAKTLSQDEGPHGITVNSIATP